MSVAEFSRKDQTKSCQEEDAAKNVFLCLSFEDPAVAFIKVEQFIVIFRLDFLLNQRVHSLLVISIVWLVHLLIFFNELVLHWLVE